MAAHSSLPLSPTLWTVPQEPNLIFHSSGFWAATHFLRLFSLAHIGHLYKSSVSPTLRIEDRGMGGTWVSWGWSCTQVYKVANLIQRAPADLPQLQAEAKSFLQRTHKVLPKARGSIMLGACVHAGVQVNLSVLWPSKPVFPHHSTDIRAPTQVSNVKSWLCDPLLWPLPTVSTSVLTFSPRLRQWLHLPVGSSPTARLSWVSKCSHVLLPLLGMPSPARPSRYAVITFPQRSLP